MIHTIVGNQIVEACKLISHNISNCSFNNFFHSFEKLTRKPPQVAQKATLHGYQKTPQTERNNLLGKYDCTACTDSITALSIRLYGSIRYCLYDCTELFCMLYRLLHGTACCQKLATCPLSLSLLPNLLKCSLVCLNSLS
jgi:hypothetical protein